MWTSVRPQSSVVETGRVPDGDAGHYSRTYMSRGGGTVAGWNSQDLVSPTAVSAPGDLVVWRLRRGSPAWPGDQGGAGTYR
jgi:hypothetical protein